MGLGISEFGTTLNIFRESTVVKPIEISRLQWAGHVQR